MSHIRSPQPVNPASLNISSPRSLRPREQSLPSATPRFHPVSPQAAFASSPIPGIVVVDEHGRRLDRGHPEPRRSSPESSDDASQADAPPLRGQSAGFVGGFIHGLRRIPAAMAKHHSRESMYQQYTAEAEARAARDSRRFATPNSECKSFE